MRSPLQLVLDFLTGGEPEVAPVRSEGSAPPGQAPAPALPELPVSQAQPYSHAQANRQALLSGVPVAYRFERSRRRSIGLVVGPEGLVVRAPVWVSLRDVDQAVQERGRWILSKLQHYRERAAQNLPQDQRWDDGALLPYLEGQVRLTLAQGRPTGLGEWQDGSGLAAMQEAGQGAPAEPVSSWRPLFLDLPPGASATQVREAAEAWFRREAQALFTQRLQHFAPMLGVKWMRLSLSSARTRWGSAGIDGHIRLNWRLMHWPLSQIDYVVVHELAHLRVMNHSPQFWDTVGTILPDYKTRRAVLRQGAWAEEGN